MSADLDALAGRHAEAQAAADAAAAELASRRAEVDAEQAERGADWDRELVGQYRPLLDGLRTEEADARAAFHQAVIDTPLIAAWVRYRSVRHRRAMLTQDVESAGVRVGDERRLEPVNWRDPRLFEDVLKLAEDEAEQLAVDEASERQRRRDEHVRGNPS